MTKFVNVVMKDGKKTTSPSASSTTLSSHQGADDEDDPMKVFKKAIDNVKPQVEVKSRRVGGSTYQVPVEVGPTRASLCRCAGSSAPPSGRRGEKTMKLRLANELMDAAQNRGAAIKKKEDTHRMADANKAFAHYRW